MHRAFAGNARCVAGHTQGRRRYVPLDPGYPLERLHYMLHDSGASWLLTRDDVVPMFSVPAQCQTLCLEETALWADCRHCRPRSSRGAHTRSAIWLSDLHLGLHRQAKGVMIEHRNVINFSRGSISVWVVCRCADVAGSHQYQFRYFGTRVVLDMSRGHHVGCRRNVRCRSQRSARSIQLVLFRGRRQSRHNKYSCCWMERGLRQPRSRRVWVPERHFANFGDPFPNPSIAAAAIAAVTRNVPIRSGSVVLPLHDPIRVAEEWSMVDNISGGRVELSIASGWHPNDFVFAPQNYAKRYEVMKEGIDALCRFWRGEGIERTNGVGKPVTVHRIEADPGRIADLDHGGGQSGNFPLCRSIAQCVDAPAGAK